MRLQRRDWLKIAGMGLSSIALPSWARTPENDLPGFGPEEPFIKLSSNENPYGPSAKAIKAMTDHLRLSNRYNWQPTQQLLEALAGHHKITQDNLLLAAGSTELLDLVGRYAASNPGELVLADPTYDYWTVPLEMRGLKKVKVPLTAEKKIDLPRMLAAINSSTRLVYVCNPNNPSGTLCNRDELSSFIKEVTTKTLVLVDEAYLDFTSEKSVIDLINTHPNLVVVKTFSKIYGLAGARVGYAMAEAQLLKNIESLQSMPNGGVSGVSASAALASLQDREFVRNCLARNEKNKAVVMHMLQELQLQCIPSHTNFLYFSIANYQKDYFGRLKKSNIAGTKIYEEQGSWTRISIGTASEMQRFVNAL